MGRDDFVSTFAHVDVFVSLSVVPGPSVDAIECLWRAFKCHTSRNHRATKLRAHSALFYNVKTTEKDFD